MAKADDTSSTIVWIWLRDALALAEETLGSMALAKQRLKEWLAAGKVPWSCTSWEGLDAEGLAQKRQEQLDAERLAERRGVGRVIYSLPRAAYCSGDPRFWGATLRIDWEGNGACEARTHGAQALGIRVSRAHLLALRPPEEYPPEREEMSGSAAWITDEAKRMNKAGDIPADIKITNLAKKLEGRMKKAAANDKSVRFVKWRYIKNKLPEWGLWPVSLIK